MIIHTQLASVLLVFETQWRSTRLQLRLGDDVDDNDVELELDSKRITARTSSAAINLESLEIETNNEYDPDEEPVSNEPRTFEK